MDRLILGILLLVALLGTLALWFGVPLLAKRSMIRKLQRECARTKSLVLTYDDGPGDRLTGDLLALLAQARCQATFFHIGSRAQADPHRARAVLDAGHEVGSHSMEHLHALRVGPLRAIRDVAQGHRALREILPSVTCSRPPYGKHTLGTLVAAAALQVPIAWWTVDSGDTRVHMPRVEDVVQRVIDAGGGVVLMHDFDRGPQDRPTDRHAYVLDVTRALIAAAGAHGLTVRTFAQLVQLDPGPHQGSRA